MLSRTAKIHRETRETQISVSVDLDGTGASKLQTGLPFFDHMLEQVARHGLIDLDIKASGDLDIDATTRSKTSASHWGRQSRRPSESPVVSTATVTPMYPWTKP